MARRSAYLHIGVPGGGGGFLESALVDHATALAGVGVHHPVTSLGEMHRAAVEIRRDHRAWGYRRHDVEGTWAEICRRAHKGQGAVLVSSALLAGCTPTQVDLLLDTLSGFDVNAVVTARQPAADAAPGDDLSIVTARWADALGSAQRVHVLVVPPEVDARTWVWRALGGVVGFDATRLPVDGTGLPAYLRRALAQGAGRPAPEADEAVELAERWRKGLADGGYDVRGDTAQLLPLPGALIGLEDQLWTLADLLADNLVEVAWLREQERALVERNAKLEKKRSKLKRRLAEVD